MTELTPQARFLYRRIRALQNKLYMYRARAKKRGISQQEETVEEGVMKLRLAQLERRISKAMGLSSEFEVV